MVERDINGQTRPTRGTLTIDSWNNIGKYRDVQGAFIIFDEQRLVGSGAWTDVFLKLAKKNHWILLSATPGDTWMDYIPVFVANGFYANRTEFKRRHVVYVSHPYVKFPKVDRYLEQGHLLRLRDSLLVEMKYARHTTRHYVPMKLDFDKKTLDLVLKERWNPYTDLPITDISELFRVSRRIVNSDPSRLSALAEILGSHPRVIVFYNFNYELEMLRSLGSTISGASTLSSLEEGQTTTSQPCLDTPKASLIDPSNLSKMSSFGTGGVIATGQNGEISRTQSTPKSPRCSENTSEGPENQRCTTTGTGLRSPNSTRNGSERHLNGGESGLKTRSLRSNSVARGSDSSRHMRLETRPDATSERRELWSPKTTKSFENPCSDGPTGTQLWGTESISTSSLPRLTVAEWNGQKHEKVPETDHWLYLVQYTAGAEGWNCITTDAMVTWSWNYSWKIMEQAYGRNDRLNTLFRDLFYYQFTSDSWIDRAIERSLAGKKVFNEKRYKKGFGL